MEKAGMTLNMQGNTLICTDDRRCKMIHMWLMVLSMELFMLCQCAEVRVSIVAKESGTWDIDENRPIFV